MPTTLDLYQSEISSHIIGTASVNFSFSFGNECVSCIRCRFMGPGAFVSSLIKIWQRNSRKWYTLVCSYGS